MASDCKHTITFADGSVLRKSGVAKKRKKPIKLRGTEIGKPANNNQFAQKAGGNG